MSLMTSLTTVSKKNPGNREAIRTHNPQKTNKLGLQVIHSVCCRCNGAQHGSLHRQDRPMSTGQPDLQASGNIVLGMLQPIQRAVWHILYFDHWYRLLEKPLFQLAARGKVGQPSTSSFSSIPNLLMKLTGRRQPSFVQLLIRVSYV